MAERREGIFSNSSPSMLVLKMFFALTASPPHNHHDHDHDRRHRCVHHRQISTDRPPERRGRTTRGESPRLQKEIPSHSRIGSSGILDLTAEGSHGVHASVCLRNVLGSGSRSTRAAMIAMQGRANAVRDVA